MAISMSQRDPNHLCAIVDMGSNGIRFSISSLQPSTARIMPTLYQHRVGISLYDAQYSASGERQPIDESTIAAVIISFKTFKRTCDDFEVPETQIVVLATEATRTARNSEDFRKRIKAEVGWDVNMLPKEEEGRVGAMGIASSLPEVGGLVMDLGGGSTQLSWIVKKEESADVRLPESGAVSMPYGAAVMSRRLVEAERNGNVKRLEQEIQSSVREAYESLNVPEELQESAKDSGGFTLYLSGGGFRGWGYVLMSRHRVQPYPLPVINGFKVGRKEFLSAETVKQAAAASLEKEDDDIFRVSERRASQVPAVAFLVGALAEALPQIREVRFCQGGVREGYLFSRLATEVQAQHPLVVATEPFDTPVSSKAIAGLLQAALSPGSPKPYLDDHKRTFTPSILESFANLMYYHASHSKDLQASSALRSTTSGILAGVHGVLHEDRTLLALLLCSRWGSDVPPSDETFKRDLERTVDSPWTLWWISYVGAVAGLVATIFPAGIKEGKKGRLQLNAKWDQDEKGRSELVLRIGLSKDIGEGALDKEIKKIKKVGKGKRWIGGKDGTGHKVAVAVTTISA